MRYRISRSQFSASVRLRTERADFFLVIDHYLKKEPIREMLSATDLNNYKSLDRRDRVMRAVNLFIAGRTKQANELLRGMFSWDALKAALKSKRGLFALVIGGYVKLLVSLRLDKIGQLSLSYLKQVTRK